MLTDLLIGVGLVTAILAFGDYRREVRAGQHTTARFSAVLISIALFGVLCLLLTY